jgi:prepilin-type N-terminal cleavage/methylation domain-containing protein
MQVQSFYEYKYRGFTLIELILSVGVLSILLMISIPLTQRYVTRNNVDVLSNVVVQDLYRAQNLARSGENNGNWGVQIQSGVVTVFQGDSYVSRNQPKDETYSFASSITITGQNEYVFSKFTGKPTSAGSTTLTTNSDTKVISVSADGVIEY